MHAHEAKRGIVLGRLDATGARAATFAQYAAAVGRDTGAAAIKGEPQLATTAYSTVTMPA